MKIKWPKFKQIFSREITQLIYGVVLIIIIPVLIVVNTIYITRQYHNSTELALQNEVLTIGRIIYSSLKKELDQPEDWPAAVKNIYNQSRILLEIEILTPVAEDFKVAASSNDKRVNQVFDSSYYRYAWALLENDAVVAPSNLLSLAERQSLGADLQNSRFWLVIMPMKNFIGQKVALLSFKISSSVVDDLTQSVRLRSFRILALIVLIVILFLFIATRLWDYALLYRRIKEIDTMKDEFISMASHELRTPITAIRGYIAMVLDGSFGVVNDKIKEGLKKVMLSADKLRELVDDLLEVSRIEQGRIELEMKSLNLAPIILETIEELKPVALEKNLLIKYNEPKEQLANIMADANRLKQILVNLIGNAIKYTKRGVVEISVKSDSGKIEVKIKDTGIGMAAEAKEHLFEKFYRVKNEETKNITGTGLGLWITKQLVELQRGKIYVDSIANVGTQVTIVFPALK